MTTLYPPTCRDCLESMDVVPAHEGGTTDADHRAFWRCIRHEPGFTKWTEKTPVVMTMTGRDHNGTVVRMLAATIEEAERKGRVVLERSTAVNATISVLGGTLVTRWSPHSGWKREP